MLRLYFCGVGGNLGSSGRSRLFYNAGTLGTAETLGFALGAVGINAMKGRLHSFKNTFVVRQFATKSILEHGQQRSVVIDAVGGLKP